MEKSYVTMEQKICPVCGITFDTNAILMDKRLMNVFDMHTITGYEFCPDCEGKRKEGYVALIVIKTPSTTTSENRVMMEDACRTGEIVHVKRDALKTILNVPPEDDIMFIDTELYDYFKKINEQVETSSKSL